VGPQLDGTYRMHRGEQDIRQAADLARSLTVGQGAHSVTVTVDVVTGEHFGQDVDAIGKGATVVVTGMASDGAA
jgi:hypothetical protein